ncbi:unnamed protein product [Closterium sp. NIES-65]|nr:unnamed protein product [Closterium sp. NIES-65]
MHIGSSLWLHLTIAHRIDVAPVHSRSVLSVRVSKILFYYFVPFASSPRSPSVPHTHSPPSLTHPRSNEHAPSPPVSFAQSPLSRTLASQGCGLQIPSVAHAHSVPPRALPSAAPAQDLPVAHAHSLPIAFAQSFRRPLSLTSVACAHSRRPRSLPSRRPRSHPSHRLRAILRSHTLTPARRTRPIPFVPRSLLPVAHALSPSVAHAHCPLELESAHAAYDRATVYFQGWGGREVEEWGRVVVLSRGRRDNVGGTISAPPLSAPTSFRPTPFRPTPFRPTPFRPTPFRPTPFRPTPFRPTPFRPNPVCPTPSPPQPFPPHSIPDKRKRVLQLLLCSCYSYARCGALRCSGALRCCAVLCLTHTHPLLSPSSPLPILSSPHPLLSPSSPLPILSSPHPLLTPSSPLPILSSPILSSPHPLLSPSSPLPILSSPHPLLSPSSPLPILSSSILSSPHPLLSHPLLSHPLLSPSSPLPSQASMTEAQTTCMDVLPSLAPVFSMSKAQTSHIAKGTGRWKHTRL